MKKLFGLILVFSLFASPAFAYSDVEENTEAITVLTDLGLMQGYDDGTFRPGQNISRAEFSAVVIRALNMESAVKNTTADTGFSDVKQSDWFSGYVKIAREQKIIDGYEDGTFRPDENILYMEAVKMLVCLLGYAPKFESSSGAYPNEYLMLANQQGLTRGASGISTKPATRAQIAVLTYNALTIPMMVQISYGEKAEYAVNQDSLLLTTSLGISKAEAEIKEVKDGAVTLIVNKANSLLYDGESIQDGENTFQVGGKTELKDYLNKKCFVFIDMGRKEVKSFWELKES